MCELVKLSWQLLENSLVKLWLVSNCKRLRVLLSKSFMYNKKYCTNSCL